jgi:hypothetical protein
MELSSDTKKISRENSILQQSNMEIKAKSTLIVRFELLKELSRST